MRLLPEWPDESDGWKPGPLAAGILSSILDIPATRLTVKAVGQRYDRIRARIEAGIDELSDGINAGILSPVEWHNAMVDLLRVGYTAAYMDGRGVTTLTPGAERQIARMVAGQVEYLNGFLDQIEADGWSEAMRSRARSYGRSTRQAAERGGTFGLDLPQVPGDGRTRCLSNCKCNLRIRMLDAEELDADVYWQLGSAEHCEDCVRLSREWRPLRIRGGEVVR